MRIDAADDSFSEVFVAVFPRKSAPKLNTVITKFSMDRQTA
jgi:hypothetical protein